MMQQIRIAFALAAAAGLSLATGCVSVLPDAPPAAARYLLDPAAFETAATPMVAWSLAIDDPQSTRVYDTTKMALMRAAGRIEYYSAGEWADRAPSLVQAAIIRSFENSGRVLSVGDRPALPFSDLILQTDIRSMQAVYSAGVPTATIEIYARLTSPRGKVHAARLFRQEVAASRDATPEVAAAFNQAMTAMLKDIVGWTFDEANAAYAK